MTIIKKIVIRRRYDDSQAVHGTVKKDLSPLCEIVDHYPYNHPIVNVKWKHVTCIRCRELKRIQNGTS